MAMEFSPATLETKKNKKNGAIVLKFYVKTIPHPDFKIKTASSKIVISKQIKFSKHLRPTYSFGGGYLKMCAVRIKSVT